MAEDAGFSWLTVKDYSSELDKFAQLVADEKSREIIAVLKEHIIDPQVIIVSSLDEPVRRKTINECVAIVYCCK